MPSSGSEHPASPPYLIQYWHEADPPGYIAELLESFKEQNPEMEHLVFDDAGAEEFIGEHYGPRELTAFRACGVPAMRADYFRYCAGHALGGIYADADYRCVAPLDSAIADDAGGQLFRVGSVLINSVFGFREPGHPLLDLAIEIATELIEQRFAARVSEVTGPGVFTVLYHLHRFPVKSSAAFLRHLGEGAEPVPGGPDDLPSLDLLRSPTRRDLAGRVAAAVGRRDRLDRAFEDVRVSPGRAIHQLVTEEKEVPYKQLEEDWRRAGADIYREAGRRSARRPDLRQ